MATFTRTDRLRPDDLWGWNLRFSLLTLLWERGRPCTISELIAELERRGLSVRGHPPKTVGDALRHEVSIGRARRVSRGCYVGLPRPATTVRRHRERMNELVRIAAVEADLADRARLAEIGPDWMRHPGI